MSCNSFRQIDLATKTRLHRQLQSSYTPPIPTQLQ
ncbi:hypothetical protein FVEN_g13058 [Fusarium venenatum]|nr:hypothetical protein FVEN_g13058 [Fusarium venenatum]